MDETNNNLEPTQITPMSSEQASITQELVQPVTEQIIIGEELTADDVNRIYTKLGRPESPDKYDLSGIVPDTYNQDVLEQFKQKAHETGMSQEGVRKMAEWYKEVEVKQHEAINKARAIQDDQHIMTLKTELGANFDAEVKNARKALDAYTDKAFKQYMDE